MRCAALCLGRREECSAAWRHVWHVWHVLACSGSSEALLDRPDDSQSLAGLLHSALPIGSTLVTPAGAGGVLRCCPLALAAGHIAAGHASVAVFWIMQRCGRGLSDRGAQQVPKRPCGRSPASLDRVFRSRCGLQMRCETCSWPSFVECGCLTAACCLSLLGAAVGSCRCADAMERWRWNAQGRLLRAAGCGLL